MSDAYVLTGTTREVSEVCFIQHVCILSPLQQKWTVANGEVGISDLQLRKEPMTMGTA